MEDNDNTYGTKNNPKTLTPTKNHTFFPKYRMPTVEFHSKPLKEQFGYQAELAWWDNLT